MDATKFVKECFRMCKSYPDCDKCPAYSIGYCFCFINESNRYEEIVEIVEKWSNETFKWIFIPDVQFIEYISNLISA